MKNFVKFLLVSAFVVPSIYAQELTSDISGNVSSADGALAGANVEITYVPTNTKVVRTSNEDGQFFAGGLRPGGPYKVTVTSAGLLSETITSYLVVGETSRLSFVLASQDSIDDVVVVGQQVASNEVYGYTTTIDAETIESTPSVTRDIKDLLRLNPLVSLDDAQDDYESISIAGAHPRSNDIKVDGVSFNDDFGLNDNGYPAQRSPINFDAIDQLSVKVAPVSVEYSNFRGGVIEVVTKGGTNEFTGSVSYFDRSSDFYGDSIRGRDASAGLDEKDDTAQGFNLGGPIIKDKAFFYVTYEESTITNPVLFGPVGSGAPIEQKITLDQVNAIRQKTIDLYGWDPLGVPSTTESNQENTSVRLDYIHNDDHRIEYTYKLTEGDRLRAGGGEYSFSFESNSYLKTESTETHSFHLVSNWSDNLITDLYWSTKETETGQDSPIGDEYPNFLIRNDTRNNITDVYGMSSISLGPDIFRSANALATTTDFIKFKAIYYKNNHKITAGFENTVYDIFNVFIVAQDGQWTFTGEESWENGEATRFIANNAKSGNYQDAAAIFEYGLTSLYLMDEIDISDKLKLTLGLRYDEYDSDDSPAKNQDFENTYGFANAGIDGADLLNYRIGLDYVIDDYSKVNVVLGTFSSKLPTVWISNAYTNDGVRVSAYNSLYAPDGCNPEVAIGSTIPGCAQKAITDAPLTSAKIDFIAPSFEWPESTVLNVVYQRDLKNDWNFTATYLYAEQEEALYKIIDGSPLIGDQPQIPSLKAPDGRPIYDQQGDGTYKAGLYNDCCGERQVASFTFDKTFNDGDGRFSISYTHQSIDELSGMTSSTSNSNFGKTGAIDYNNRKPMRSIYETEHRLLATLSNKYYFFGEDKPTTITWIYERKSGLPAYASFDTWNYNVNNYQSQSFGYEYNLNDDSSALLYIPSGLNDPLVCWTYQCKNEGTDLANKTANILINHLHNTLGLDKYAGTIAPRGSLEFPWQSSLDLKIKQVLPGFRADDELIITLGIENVLNMLNDDWGVIEYGYYSGSIPIMDLNIYEGKYVYSLIYDDDGSIDRGLAYGYNLNDPMNTNISYTQSVWRAQLGFVYKF